MQKLKNSEIFVCFAGLSALYTCYTANNFWSHMLSQLPETSLFSHNVREILIYSSFYVSLFSSVLMILFDELRILRLCAFVASFSLAALLTETYGYQDWFLHPIVMFNLLFFDVKSDDQKKSFAKLYLSVAGAVALVTITVLLLQFYSGGTPLQVLSYKEKWLRLFEMNPGVGFTTLSQLGLSPYCISLMIFGLLLAFPLATQSRVWSTLFFIGAVGYWLIQKRMVQNNMLAWLIFVFSILILGIYGTREESK